MRAAVCLQAPVRCPQSSHHPSHVMCYMLQCYLHGTQFTLPIKPIIIITPEVHNQLSKPFYPLMCPIMYIIPILLLTTSMAGVTKQSYKWVGYFCTVLMLTLMVFDWCPAWPGCKLLFVRGVAASHQCGITRSPWMCFKFIVSYRYVSLVLGRHKYSVYKYWY